MTTTEPPDQPLRVALAQIDPTVGDIQGNRDLILDAWHRAHDTGADLVVFPELAVTGYPPEDLLLKPAFVAANVEAIESLATEGPEGTVAVVGYVGLAAHDPDADEDGADWDVTVPARDLRNSAAVIADGSVVARYHKWRLPNYGVFDEARYFVPDDDVLVLSVAGVGVAVTICEDLWTEDGPASRAAAAGAEVVLSLNASPYHRGKRDQRERWARHHATTDRTHVVFVNQVGGQDELVFDGDSFLIGRDGTATVRGAQFAPDLPVADVQVERVGVDGPSCSGFRRARDPLPPPTDVPRLGPVEEVWGALRLGVRDYCRKNGFGEALVGLSGGIDSAVTAAIAADALGAENVLGVGMPSPWSSDHSLEDARALAEMLGMPYEEIPIQPMMGAFEEALAPLFDGLEPDVTEENIQARIRGVLLMAISNKFGRILLTTGNKTEMAVGYATLYGDMAGGFAVLKDVPKLLVFELARWRNSVSPAIPERSITKPPSAELRPDQVDTDSLPEYEILDPIVCALVEEDRSIADIVASGLGGRALVERVSRMIDIAEYKRRQAPPGVKITERAFGKDRRVPITNGWRDH